MPKDIICPCCNEFIGRQGELEECPLCGYNLLEEEE